MNESWISVDYLRAVYNLFQTVLYISLLVVFSRIISIQCSTATVTNLRSAQWRMPGFLGGERDHGERINGSESGAPSGVPVAKPLVRDLGAKSPKLNRF